VILYGSSVAGQFAIVQRVTAVPLFLLTVGVADVFHSSMAQHARSNPQKCTVLFQRTALGLFIVGLVPACIFFIGGEPLFAFVFGSRWALAGIFASAVAPWFLMQFVVSPLSRVVLVFHGQEFKLIYDLLTVFSIAAVFGFAKKYSLGAVQTVRWLSAVNTVAYGVYFLVLVYVLSRSCPADAANEPIQEQSVIGA